MPVPVRVDPLVVDLGTVDGHRVVLLSVEVYDTWADLRFARVEQEAVRPLPRRVPASEAWTITVNGQEATVVDAVGRGDRAFSNGEVRFDRPPQPGDTVTVAVIVTPGTAPLTTTWTVPAATD